MKTKRKLRDSIERRRGKRRGRERAKEKNGWRAKFRGDVIQFAGIISAKGERVSKFYREVGTRGEKRAD